MNVELQAMIDSTNVQKNVNMKIKDGLKKINELVDLISKDHSLAREMKEVTSGTSLSPKMIGRIEENSAKEYRCR